MKTIEALVACSDLTGYAKLTHKLTEEKVFEFLSDYYEFVGDTIAPARGEIIKFMGDASLMVFPENQADAGINILLQLQSEGDRYLSNQGLACRHHIRSHFGPMQMGLLGTRENKHPDVIGATVNTLFLLKSSDFAMTPEAFRKLKPETRTLFKKHTPPITYIPLSQRH